MNRGIWSKSIQRCFLPHPLQRRAHAYTACIRCMYACVDEVYIFSRLSNQAVYFYFSLQANCATFWFDISARESVFLGSVFFTNSLFFKFLGIFKWLLILFWCWLSFVNQHVVCARECPCELTVVTGGGSSQTCCIYLPTTYLSMDWSFLCMWSTSLSLLPSFSFPSKLFAVFVLWKK